MALPQLHFRGDMIVKVDWTAADGAPGATWTPFCGANSATLNIDNAIQETTVGDCDDWTLPAKVIASYGAQTVTMTVDAALAASNRDLLLRWGNNQLTRPIRLQIVNAPVGEVEYIDGQGMLQTLNLGGLATTDGAPISITLNFRMRDGVELTNATV